MRELKERKILTHIWRKNKRKPTTLLRPGRDFKSLAASCISLVCRTNHSKLLFSSFYNTNFTLESTGRTELIVTT